MKKLNFNLKDRKTLFLVLGLMIVSVFTLTVVYAALNTVLTIQGNARVSAADWDIYLNNPRVTNGSATTDVPQIKTSSTLEFSTTLNMPGDFYEFTVDVVNGGSIDAMIENVVKNPELTSEQAKYLKYEVSYQNGEAISTKQLLAKETSMPIKVRIEYRNDLVASDLPTGQVVLDLSLTLEYVQSDGTGTTVNNNGVYVNPVSANGDINEIGTIVTIGTEQFYTIGTEGSNVKMLSRHNLYVGGSGTTGGEFTPYGNEATGMQKEGCYGGTPGSGMYFCGVTAFSTDEHKGVSYVDYNGSLVEYYVNDYKQKLEDKFNVDVIESRILNGDELVNVFGCDLENDFSATCATTEKNSWLFNTSFWTSHLNENNELAYVFLRGEIYFSDHIAGYYAGVRPVIIISKDYFN